MRLISLLLLAGTALAPATGAAAQPAQGGPQIVVDHRYGAAPWWMREPVITSIGYVRVELPANRANFDAAFAVVEKSPSEATAKAADKVRALGEALSALGADKVRIVTTFTTTPLYEQYRDKNGNMIDNQRGDKIEHYQVRAEVAVEVRDTRLLEQAYATVIAARPTATSPVSFRLDPDNETKTALYTLAVRDAARRARLATENAGAKLGAAKVIDPTARACQTDVLAGSPSDKEDETEPTSVDAADVADAAAAAPMIQPRVAAPPPMAPPPPAKPSPRAQLTADALAMKLPIQPPLQEMTAQSCVVYALME